MTTRKATAKTKFGGLSTPQQTMKLSVARVKMTPFFLDVEERQNNCKSNSIGNSKSNGNPPFTMNL
jgi:hypothetical protein